MSLVLAVTTKVTAQQVPENLVQFKGSTINRVIPEDIGSIFVTIERLNPVGNTSKIRVSGSHVNDARRPDDWSIPDYPRFPHSFAEFGSGTEVDIRCDIVWDDLNPGDQNENQQEIFYVVLGGSLENCTFYPGIQTQDGTIVPHDDPAGGGLPDPSYYSGQLLGKIVIDHVPKPVGEPGTVQFASSTFSVEEDAGSAVVQVERVDATDETAAVTFSTSDGTGEAGVKYTPVTTVLNWANGENGVRDVTIPVFQTYPDVTISWDDNASNEDGFEIERSLNGGGWVSLGTVGQNVTQFVENDVNINDTRQYRVRSFNTDGDSSWATSTSYTYTGPGFDRTVNLSLSNVANAALGTSSAVLTVTDVDTVSGTVNLVSWKEGSAARTVSEGSGTLTLTVKRENPLGDCSCRVHTSGVTATSGVDYEGLPKFPVSASRAYFTGSQVEATVDIDIYEDSTNEGSETFEVIIGNEDNCTKTDPFTAIVTITDND